MVAKLLTIHKVDRGSMTPAFNVLIDKINEMIDAGSAAGGGGEDLTAQVAANTAAIATNKADIATNKASITSNATDIGTNASDIAALSARVDALESAAPEASAEGVVGFSASFEGGSGEFKLPSWQQLVFTDSTGDGATISDGSLIITAKGSIVVEVRCKVLHNWGKSVIFGYAWDGGPIEQFASYVIESNDPVLVLSRYHGTADADGKKLDLYISSDFEYEKFSWSDGEIDMVEVDDG